MPPTTSAPPRVRDWSPGDRPRERLRERGPWALADRELLALLVGSGGRSGSALDVAARVLDAAGGSLRSLAARPATELEGVAGVGAATAARLAAALELGRRTAAERGDRGARVRGPRDVYDRMAPRLRDLPQEEYHVLLVDTRHRVLRDVLVTRGPVDASLVHPREVFRAAVAGNAAGVILVHNHPSGVADPSPEDRRVTRQMVAAGEVVGIPVLDHVIVGDGVWRSLAEEGGLG
ncbi:MAG: DNA repair protein RadC [Gemmatimonadetes bacterium]|nr:DNA repair protein RadC [Gemmatimonadota bacterium]